MCVGDVTLFRMARISQIIEVCDVCGAVDKPVTHYRLAPDGGRLRKLALCEDHDTHLRELVKTLSLWSTGRSSRQVTMEQIEEVKKRQRRPAGKKAAAKTS